MVNRATRAFATSRGADRAAAGPVPSHAVAAGRCAHAAFCTAEETR